MTVEKPPPHVACIFTVWRENSGVCYRVLWPIYLSSVAMISFFFYIKGIWKDKIEWYKGKELGNFDRSVNTNLCILYQTNQFKIPGWGWSSVMECLPSMCMAPGFIVHCPNYIKHFSPFCFSKYHTTSLLPADGFSMSPPYPWVFSCVFGVRKKLVSPAYCRGVGWEKFHLSVLWGGGDIIRHCLPPGTFTTVLDPAFSGHPPTRKKLEAGLRAEWTGPDWQGVRPGQPHPILFPQEDVGGRTWAQRVVGTSGSWKDAG